MRDHASYRRAAIRYWELRRIIYNLALVPPSVFGYLLTDVINWAGDPHERNYRFVFTLFVVCALAANLCYSFAYALEFLFGDDEPSSRWTRFGRTTVFLGGMLISLFLALVGGQCIAVLEWDVNFMSSNTLP